MICIWFMATVPSVHCLPDCCYLQIFHLRYFNFPLNILSIPVNSIFFKKGIFVETASGASTKANESTLREEFHQECIKDWKALLDVWVSLLRAWEGKAISLVHAQKRTLQCLSTQVLSDSQFAKMPLIMLCSHPRGFSLSFSLKILTALLWIQRAGITCCNKKKIVILDCINNFSSLKEQRNISENYGEHKNKKIKK